MGAETQIYVRCIVCREEWREVSALGLRDAMRIADDLPGVAHALEAKYEKPAELGGDAV
jgi:hypothetical protein